MLAFALAGAGAEAAAVPDRAGGMKPGVVRGGFQHVNPNYPFRFRLPNGQLLPVRRLARQRAARRFRLLSHQPELGELRNWAALDIVQGAFYPKAFALRGVGRKIEVWVSEDLDYPATVATARGPWLATSRFTG